MEHIVARHNAAAAPAHGKHYVLGVAQMLLELSIVQLIIGLLIKATGIQALSLIFYACAALLPARFVMRTAAGSVHTLRGETLTLQRMLGDTVVLKKEIPLGDIVSVRPYAYGQRLKLDYRQVAYIDTRCVAGLRMRAAFAVSLIWAWLARVIAGKKARREAGILLVYMVGRKRRACAFRPDEAFARALKDACPDAFGTDERLAREPLETYWAKSLRRAFGGLYPHVPDAVSAEELAFEREEFARRRQKRIEKAAKKKNISLEAYQRQLGDAARKRAAARRKRMRLYAHLSERLSFLEPAKASLMRIWEALTREEAQGAPAHRTQEDAPRRRRGRQE